MKKSGELLMDLDKNLDNVSKCRKQWMVFLINQEY